MLICAAIVLVRVRAARLVAVAGLVAVVAPLIPVSGEMQARWAFAPWLLATATIGFLPIALPRGAAIAATLALMAALVVHRVEWPRAYRLFLRMSDEARVFAQLSAEDILRNPASPPASIPELALLTGSRGQAFYDDLPLCGPSRQARRIFEYNAARRQVLETTNAEIQRSCTSIRQMPLELRLHFEPDGVFYWTAGPYRDGAWAFILGDGRVAYEVPREGGFRAPGLDHFHLRVRYTSPAGWKTYSPVFQVDARKGPLVHRQ